MINHEMVTTGDTACLTIKGRIYEKEAAALKLYFQSQQLCRFREVVLDLQGLTHLGNAGIGRILLLYKAMADCRGTVRLTGTPPHIASQLNALHINDLIEISSN